MALAVNSSTGSTYQTNVASITYAHDCGSGSNRFLAIPVSPNDATLADRTVDSVTYAGASCAHASADADTASYERSEMWYKFAPATGSNNIVVTFASGGPTCENAIGYSVSFTGADQSATDAEHGNFISVGETPVTEPITTVAADAYVISIFSSSVDVTTGVGGSQTDMGALAGDYVRASYSGPHASPGAVTHSYSVGSSSTGCVSMLSIKPSATTTAIKDIIAMGVIPFPR